MACQLCEHSGGKPKVRSTWPSQDSRLFDVVRLFAPSTPQNSRVGGPKLTPPSVTHHWVSTPPTPCYFTPLFWTPSPPPRQKFCSFFFGTLGQVFFFARCGQTFRTLGVLSCTVAICGSFHPFCPFGPVVNHFPSIGLLLAILNVFSQLWNTYIFFSYLWSCLSLTLDHPSVHSFQAVIYPKFAPKTEVDFFRGIFRYKMH